MGIFEIRKLAHGQFNFTLKADNGEIILVSEMYKAKDSAINGIQSVKKNASLDVRYEKKLSAKSQPYFVLKAGNHEIIGVSEMYSSEGARDQGIAAVKANAPEAKIVDLSVT